MAMQVPTITVVSFQRINQPDRANQHQDDLCAFHAKHFPTAKLPSQFFYGAEPTDEAPQEHYDDHDGGLGYYEDGVERTLTDEQIAMFRHSEIQTILRKRRHRLENEEPIFSDSESEQALKNSSKPVQASSPAKVGQHSQMDRVQHGRVEKDDRWTKMCGKTKEKTQRKNAKNRKAHRKRKKEEKKKKWNENTAYEQMDEDSESDEWDPWHQAKGPDVQKDTTVDLDY